MVKINNINLKNEDILFTKRSDWVVKQYLHVHINRDGERYFLKFRKKHNRSYIEVATHQYFADTVKSLFDLKKVGVEVVYDSIEGFAIKQKWHNNIGTVKSLNNSKNTTWATSTNLIELIKICFFDGLIGSLDRHGNNVLVLNDMSLLAIDDEDLFYYEQPHWIKFDKNIRRLLLIEYNDSKELLESYKEKIRGLSTEILDTIETIGNNNDSKIRYWERPYINQFKTAFNNYDLIWSRMIEQFNRN